MERIEVNFLYHEDKISPPIIVTDDMLSHKNILSADIMEGIHHAKENQLSMLDIVVDDIIDDADDLRFAVAIVADYYQKYPNADKDTYNKFVAHSNNVRIAVVMLFDVLGNKRGYRLWTDLIANELSSQTTNEMRSMFGLR
jgi:hypothetical protein